MYSKSQYRREKSRYCRVLPIINKSGLTRDRRELIVADFFLIFMNDLLEINSSIEILAFADDIVILQKGRSLTTLYTRASRPFAKAAGWLKCDGLVLNLSKMKHMVFGSNMSNGEGTMSLHNHDP